MWETFTKNPSRNVFKEHAMNNLNILLLYLQYFLLKLLPSYNRFLWEADQHITVPRHLEDPAGVQWVTCMCVQN